MKAQAIFTSLLLAVVWGVECVSAVPVCFGHQGGCATSSNDMDHRSGSTVVRSTLQDRWVAKRALRNYGSSVAEFLSRSSSSRSSATDMSDKDIITEVPLIRGSPPDAWQNYIDKVIELEQARNVLRNHAEDLRQGKPFDQERIFADANILMKRIKAIRRASLKVSAFVPVEKGKERFASPRNGPIIAGQATPFFEQEMKEYGLLYRIEPVTKQQIWVEPDKLEIIENRTAKDLEKEAYKHRPQVHGSALNAVRYALSFRLAKNREDLSEPKNRRLSVKRHIAQYTCLFFSCKF